jgi:hypothetical protein
LLLSLVSAVSISDARFRFLSSFFFIFWIFPCHSKKPTRIIYTWVETCKAHGQFGWQQQPGSVFIFFMSSLGGSFFFFFRLITRTHTWTGCLHLLWLMTTKYSIYSSSSSTILGYVCCRLFIRDPCLIFYVPCSYFCLF